MQALQLQQQQIEANCGGTGVAGKVDTNRFENTRQTLERKLQKRRRPTENVLRGHQLRLGGTSGDGIQNYVNSNFIQDGFTADALKPAIEIDRSPVASFRATTDEETKNKPQVRLDLTREKLESKFRKRRQCARDRDRNNNAESSGKQSDASSVTKSDSGTLGEQDCGFNEMPIWSEPPPWSLLENDNDLEAVNEMLVG